MVSALPFRDKLDCHVFQTLGWHHTSSTETRYVFLLSLFNIGALGHNKHSKTQQQLCRPQLTLSPQTYPFRCKVLHPSGDLVGTGQQVFERELLLRHLGHIKGVVHAWGSPGSQVFPQTAFGGVLY